MVRNRKNPAVKNFINKNFKECVNKNDEFKIPDEYTKNKAELEKFTRNIFSQLDGMFKRAEKNINDPDKKDKAQATLTIKSHLEQRLEDIKSLSINKSTRTLDLTIKMWDRNPQKDIFQGNYSTCCTAMGDVNASTMPYQLMSSAYNMIELVDNTSGETIGNALCYFVTDENNELAFIVDNVEIRNSKKPSEEVGKKLRDKIVEFARKTLKEVTGHDDIKIYMGKNYNDIPDKDLTKVKKNMTFVGDISSDKIYMDLYDGDVRKREFTKEVEALEV